MAKKTRARPSEKQRLEASEDEELVDDLDEAEELIGFTYAITSYGADYPVDSVVDRINRNEIIVPRFGEELSEESKVIGFQRGYVWPRTKADRFIESLLLGLPVPGIFLVKEPNGIFLILDGHQRLHTLHAYYEGVIEGKEYRLMNVQERFKQKRYKDLDTEDRRRLDNSLMHSTIVRQDEPSEDQSSIYAIFERLNTGGVNLQPQEIRVALYHGEFVRVLRELNDTDYWRELFGVKSKRLKDMELILRFFAFQYYDAQYRRPMKEFLNRYMASNRLLQRQSEEKLRDIFLRTTKVIFEAIGKPAFRPIRAVNAAVVDSLMVGLSTRLTEVDEIDDLPGVKAQYVKLLENGDYMEAVETGTSQESNVENRLRLAREAFAKVS